MQKHRINSIASTRESQNVAFRNSHLQKHLGLKQGKHRRNLASLEVSSHQMAPFLDFDPPFEEMPKVIDHMARNLNHIRDLQVAHKNFDIPKVVASVQQHL